MPIGTPDSGSSLSSARALSAASAAASAWSGVSTMKALSALAAATFALNASATSRAVNSPLRKPSRIAATVRSVRFPVLFDHLRHGEKAVFGLRRVGEHLFATISIAPHILPQAAKI